MVISYAVYCRSLTVGSDMFSDVVALSLIEQCAGLMPSMPVRKDALQISNDAFKKKDLKMSATVTKY